MSVTVTTDIFCDYPGCGTWGHGTVGNDAAPNLARRCLTVYGWRRRRFQNPAGLTVTVDLCPDHADIEEFPWK